MTDRTNPMTTDAMLKLAERCEQATGPDRELDLAVWKAVGGRYDTPRYDADYCPAYSASLDAAMTLIDDSEVWGVSKQEDNPGRDYYFTASVMPFGPKPWHEARAATPALALCAAALKARASQ